MRYLIIFLLFFSSYAFSDDPPMPSCASSYPSACLDPTDANALSSKISQCFAHTEPTKHFFTGVDAGCGQYYKPGVGYVQLLGVQCGVNCSCPEGYTYSTGFDTSGNPVSDCVSNDTSQTQSSSGSSCAAGQAYYDGLCRDVVSSPSECGSTYTDAIDTGSGYACSNNGGCPSDYSASVYTDQSGSWNVCSPSSSSGNSSDSGNQQSSISNSTSGGDSSSGSGSGGGTGGGDNGGVSGSSSSAASDSSGSGTGGGSASSAAGGSASSAGNGSASSGSGNAASSAGAGDCDPTAKNYLDCLTSDIPQNAGHDIADHSMDGAQQKTGDGFNNYMGELQGQIDGVVNGGSGVGEGGVSGLGDSLMGYLPSPASCQPIMLSYHGWSASIDCYYIDIWKMWFGWFLNIVVALHLYNLARKPVEI